MSRFTEKMYRNARTVTTGMVTGEPYEPVRHTWGEVHERARAVAGGLAEAGIGLGDSVGVLAGGHSIPPHDRALIQVCPTAACTFVTRSWVQTGDNDHDYDASNAALDPLPRDTTYWWRSRFLEMELLK